MSLPRESFWIDASLGLLSALVVTGLWSMFVWVNNWYVARRGGGLLKYGAWRLFLTCCLVLVVLDIVDFFKK